MVTLDADFFFVKMSMGRSLFSFSQLAMTGLLLRSAVSCRGYGVRYKEGPFLLSQGPLCCVSFCETVQIWAADFFSSTAWSGFRICPFCFLVSSLKTDKIHLPITNIDLVIFKPVTKCSEEISDAF